MIVDGSLEEKWGLNDNPDAAEKRLLAEAVQALRDSLGVWGRLVPASRLKRTARATLFSVCFFQARACLQTKHKDINPQSTAAGIKFTDDSDAKEKA